MLQVAADTGRRNGSAPARLHRLLIPALLAAFTGVLYLGSLRSDSLSLTDDELFAALTAHSVAATGRDLNGRFMPPLFEMSAPFADDYWFLPIPIYLLAALLKAVPLSEAAVRLPMTLFAIVDVVLIYLVARRLFARESLAIATAAILAMTPVHYFFAHHAIGFAAHLPFVLGWLLCLLNYLDGNDRRWLFGAGLLLGIGLYTYVAAAVLVPLYFLLTCLVLLAQREGIRSVLTLAGGFMLPASPALIFLLLRSTDVIDLFTHYQSHEGQFRSAEGPADGLGVVRRLTDYGRMYIEFLAPRLWFVTAHTAREWDPRIGGVFLFPAVGLFVAALIRLVTRPTVRLLLIAGGLACAPVAPSLTPKVDVMHRLMAMLPFGALISILGLEHLATATGQRARAFAFVAVWASVIGLAVSYHGSLRDGQAIARAGTVPLAVCGLAILLGPATIGRARIAHAAGTVLLTLAILQIVYLSVPHEIVVAASVALIALVGAGPLWPGAIERLGRSPLVAVAWLAVVAGLFMHMYVDDSTLPWLPTRHMTATLVAARFAAASAVSLAALWCVRRINIEHLSRWRASAVLVAVAVASLAFYYMDYFADFPIRFAHAAGVLLLVAVVAQACRSGVAGRPTLAHITAAAFFSIAASQFAFAYPVINVTRRVTFDRSPERAAFETVLARARERPIPVIYVGNVESMVGVYWRFVAITRGREDLLSRMIIDGRRTPDRIADLPVGSVALVSHTPEAAEVISHLVADGRVTGDILRIPGGAPRFWVLERVP